MHGILHPDGISIHAPHARSDLLSDCHHTNQAAISIHAPHARSDGKHEMKLVLEFEFQSTLLMRGATSRIQADDGSDDYISIHAPHARSDAGTRFAYPTHQISIHAPHARSDKPPGAKDKFLAQISIHAPHARSDPLLSNSSIR